MMHRCLCPCHTALGERQRADGVDVRDPIATLTACSVCSRHHSVPPVVRTDNGESNPYGPPTDWTGEEGG